jgi:MSHA biogenesis protein MshP
MKLRMIRKSGGVALVTAIFLLVVLAGLGVAVVSLTTSQQSSATQDEQGARAYQAAKAGLEWALYIQLERGRAPNVTNALGCPVIRSFGLSAPTLAAYTVTVQCTQPEGGYHTPAPPELVDPTAGGIRITVTACNQPANNACPNPTPGPDYVQRVIEAQL